MEASFQACAHVWNCYNVTATAYFCTAASPLLLKWLQACLSMLLLVKLKWEAPSQIILRLSFNITTPHLNLSRNQNWPLTSNCFPNMVRYLLSGMLWFLASVEFLDNWNPTALKLQFGYFLHPKDSIFYTSHTDSTRCSSYALIIGWFCWHGCNILSSSKLVTKYS